MQRKKSSAGATLSSSFFAILLFVSTAFAAGPKEQALYRFHGGSDGNSPMASLIVDKSGNLYGTTNLGGSANCATGCGTVFQLSPPAKHGTPWTETVIHSFQGGTDGAYPYSPLITDAAGNLYGTTSAGGTGNCDDIQQNGCGTVFELSPAGGGTWTYQVLYSFQGVPSGQGNGDAAWPAGLAFGQGGILYGFAWSGGHCKTDETGTSCSRAAFALKNSGGKWTESVIYRFPGPYYAYAGPILDKAGNLYGAGPGGAYGFGGVFRLNPPANGKGWTQAAIYDFHGSTGDGAFPDFGLVFDAAGNLYGATLGTPAGSFSNVVELSPTQTGEWTESVLYNFNPISTGYEPGSGPILGQNGHLYGTTSQGGQSGRGVVFELIPPSTQGGAWTETVLYSFLGGSGGDAPEGGVIFGLGGALYGTTAFGGDLNCGNGSGCGTIFKVVP